MRQEYIPEDVGGTWIGTCVHGDCERPAAVRIHEDFIACSLHYAVHVLATEVDEAHLAVKLMRGWRSQAALHDNSYLGRLLSRSIEECKEREDTAESLLSDVRRGADVESEPSQDYHASLKQPEDEVRDAVAESNSLLTQAIQLLGDADVPEGEREELIKAKHAISEAGLIVSRMESRGAATATAPEKAGRASA